MYLYKVQTHTCTYQKHNFRTSVKKQQVHTRTHTLTHKHVSTKKERRRKDVPRSLTTLFHAHKNPKFFVHVIDYNYNTVQILYSAVHRTERLYHIFLLTKKGKRHYFQLTATDCIRSFAHVTIAFTWIRNGSTPLATHHHHHPSPSFFTYHCDKCLNYFPEHNNKCKILACNHTL